MYVDFQSHPVTETDETLHTDTSTKQVHGTILRTIIITLYVLATISFVIDWVFELRAFIKYGDNYYTVFSALMDDGSWWWACFLTDAITGGGSTLLVDVTIVRQLI